MTANELFKMEHENQNEIHLVKAGMFWQAWEKSAFFFVKTFEKYEVKTRFIKKINAEMVYLGFPEEALSKIYSKAESQKCTIEKLNDSHIVLRDFLLHSGFESWKYEVYRAGVENHNRERLGLLKDESFYKTQELNSHISDANFLLAFKETYESVKYIFTRTGETSKLYRYGLGDKLRGECLDFLDMVNCANLGSKKFDGCFAFELFCRIRIKLRMLLDFHEISEKQWFYISERLDKIKQSLRLESFGLRFNGAC